MYYFLVVPLGVQEYQMTCFGWRLFENVIILFPEVAEGFTFLGWSGRQGPSEQVIEQYLAIFLVFEKKSNAHPWVSNVLLHVYIVVLVTLFQLTRVVNGWEVWNFFKEIHEKASFLRNNNRTIDRTPVLIEACVFMDVDKLQQHHKMAQS